MLKKIAFKKIMIVNLSLLIILLIVLFPKETDHQDITYIDSIKMPIYLIDRNNYVARVNILKSTNDLNENIKTIIDALTINSNSSLYLPNDFKAIIPKNTKLLNFSIQDNLLKLNFSKEFLNVEQDNEEKLIEAIVYSLTEIKGIDKIMIFINSEKLNVLPKSKKILPDILDKSYGINKVYNITNLKESRMITTYYIGKNELFNYYIPVSEITSNKEEKIEIIIKNLKHSPYYQTNLISYLKASTNLANYQILENTINLSFDNDLIANLTNKDIIEEVKYTMYLSLRDTYNITSLVIDTPDSYLPEVILD